MSFLLPYQIFPLGDTALTIDFGNTIDENVNREVMNRFHQLQKHELGELIELVPAYSSLTVQLKFPFNHKKIPREGCAFDWLKQQLDQILQKPSPVSENPSQTIRIPVCYESLYAPDLSALAAAKKMTPEEVVNVHTAGNYLVYMLGFIPGFAYMGELDKRIMMPRKSQPVTVPAGSVGIAGKQTGIYPLTSPGGWHIIGRTPLKMFNAEQENPVLLNAGDRVQFISISSHEFENY